MSIFSLNRATTFSSLTWFSDTAFAQWIVNNIVPFGTSICDFGCANGFMLDYYKKYFDLVIGIEPNESFFKHCSTKYENDEKVKLLNVTAEKSNLTDKSVDIAISRSALHHFVNIEAAVNEMIRISKNNCISLIEVIAPSPVCLPFLKKILTMKEKGRNPNTVFTENNLRSYLSPYSDNIISLHFDQFILVDTWLDNSDLSAQERSKIKEIILSQPAQIKSLMQMHYQNGEISMLRRMNLQIIYPKYD